MNLDSNAFTAALAIKATSIGLKLLGALALWIIGGGLVRLAVRLLRWGMSARKLDATLALFAENALSLLLKIVLVVAILGYFGLEVSAFAAVLAATGLAIGLAWSGLLSHYAAGVFMMVLRPFKVGDIITAGGVSGYVAEIGLFTTAIVTSDWVRTLVGNNKIFSGTIHNHSGNPYRRVNMTVQLSHGEDHRAAIALIQEKLAAIPNVVKTPAPEVHILTFTPAGPVLAVRPYTHIYNLWPVVFATNLAIREAGFSVPETHARYSSWPCTPSSAGFYLRSENTMPGGSGCGFSAAQENHER